MIFRWAAVIACVSFHSNGFRPAVGSKVSPAGVLGEADPPPTTPEGLQVPVESTPNKAKVTLDASMYIVQMSGKPAVAYEGDTAAGIPATKPAKGEKINPNNPNVIKYCKHLANQHNTTLAQVVGAGAGSDKKRHDYSVSFNGFSVKLTKQQAVTMLDAPGVLSVTADKIMSMDTISTPEFLGLNDPVAGPWTLGHEGEDIIIGIIDSGAWPENPSFDDRTGSNKKGVDGKLDYQQIPGWNGKCVPGENFTAADCNHKLIGATWFGEGFGGEEGINATFPNEFVSPRALDGHGVHVASTAGGNMNVEAIIEGTSLGFASGMAPRARISSYKVCWGDEGLCPGSDQIAAIDQAVLDGVDVINFSISGTRTDFLYPVEVAFLFAADAGVFVAASAGNSGPDPYTVAHPSPWITTVAAGSNGRILAAQVSLGDEEDSPVFDGASIQDSGTDLLDLVYAANVKLEEANLDEARLCYPGTLDPELVAGKMVLCDRGVIARVAKSEEVSTAEGAAMILANVGPGSLNADFHSVPSIHVVSDDGDDIRNYISQTVSPKARISPGTISVDPLPPQVAGFSSRGPSLASADLLKPDIMAPGVGILAAVSPVSGSGEDFDFKSGTSMSSPHIAGLAAVVKSAHPDWTPMMIKSALMTSSDDTAASPFEEGSGHVNPIAAINPGLVYESGFDDWLGFLCGTGQLVLPSCPSVEIDPSNLNGPNVAIGVFVAEQTVTRSVTNVGPDGTYVLTVDSPPGVDVTVTPEQLNMATGATKSFDIKFTANQSVNFKQFVFGSLTWSDGMHQVRSVLALRPFLFSAPSEVKAGGESGTITFDVKFSFTGDYNAEALGLQSPSIISGNVVDDPDNSINVALGTNIGISYHFVTVPPGTVYTRFALFDSYTDGDDDLDLYIFGPSVAGFPLVGRSFSPTSEEEVNVQYPSPGEYLVVVHGWQTDGPESNYKLFSWSVPEEPVFDFPLLISSPASASFGISEPIEVTWDVTADPAVEARKYLGVVYHTYGDGDSQLTIVDVEDE